MNNIKEFKKTHPMLFHSRKILGYVYEILATYAYKLPVRRFLLELFTMNAKAKAAIPNHINNKTISGSIASNNDNMLSSSPNA